MVSAYQLLLCTVKGSGTNQSTTQSLRAYCEILGDTGVKIM